MTDTNKERDDNLEFVVLRSAIGARMEAKMSAHGIAEALWKSGYRLLSDRVGQTFTEEGFRAYL